MTILGQDFMKSKPWEKIVVQYAHCTKFTPGQLDREPHSSYENRSVECEIEVFRDMDTKEDEWIVRLSPEEILANEPDRQKAIGMAQYALMNKSRNEMQTSTV